MSTLHMTMTINGSAADLAAMTNPLSQLRAARYKPTAALIGATAGLVPVGVYEVGHYELTSWSPLECPKAVIVYAGLLFSALTVLSRSANMFGSKLKALGFTLLLEGIMMASSAAWLTAIALTYLVLINAAANGCRLVCAIPSPWGLTGRRTWRVLSPLRRQRPQRAPRSRSDHAANDARPHARQRLGSRWLPRSRSLRQEPGRLLRPLRWRSCAGASARAPLPPSGVRS